MVADSGHTTALGVRTLEGHRRSKRRPAADQDGQGAHHDGRATPRYGRVRRTNPSTSIRGWPAVPTATILILWTPVTPQLKANTACFAE